MNPGELDYICILTWTKDQQYKYISSLYVIEYQEGLLRYILWDMYKSLWNGICN